VTSVWTTVTIDAGGAEYWAGVTGYAISETRDALLPPDGDTYLMLGEPPVRLELEGGGSVRPRPASWPGGHTSLVDQICLDIPSRKYDKVCADWAARTSWPLRQLGSPEFRCLERPPGQPLRVLLQRLGEMDGRVRAHLDIATTDRAAEIARHIALGGKVFHPRPVWTAMTDPHGMVYCITDRDPETGKLPGA
jgi:hypothetical protein